MKEPKKHVLQRESPSEMVVVGGSIIVCRVCVQLVCGRGFGATLICWHGYDPSHWGLPSEVSVFGLAKYGSRRAPFPGNYPGRNSPLP